MSEERRCAGPGCAGTIQAKTGRGRPALYCSPACRETEAKRRHRLHVEVEHEPTEFGERPTGRVWSVVLSRGVHRLVIANELGRPSAEHLASAISDFLTDRGSTRGGGIS
jgi:hypothetical protein